MKLPEIKEVASDELDEIADQIREAHKADRPEFDWKTMEVDVHH